MRGHNRVRIHPLFFLVGIVSAFTGQLFLFLSATVAALEHECAHAFVARRQGFELDKIVLMPYGAVIQGDLVGIGTAQELAVLAAGPLCNAFTALGFVALWWLFPETYPYTDTAAFVSCSLALVNLLPAYPLDGGRMLSAVLKSWNKKYARIICRVVSGVVLAGVLGYFVASCFFVPNYSALAFAVLLAAGALGGGSYSRITFPRDKSFARGVEERRVAVSAEKTLGEAVRFLRDDRYLVLVLFSDGTFYGELPEEEFLSALEKGDYSMTLKEALES